MVLNCFEALDSTRCSLDVGVGVGGRGLQRSRGLFCLSILSLFRLGLVLICLQTSLCVFVDVVMLCFVL